MAGTQEKNKHIALFEGNKVRRVWHDERWFFVVEDVVLALIESKDVKQYIQRIKQRDAELSQGWVQIVHTLDIPTKGGVQSMNCADLEGIFRIVQSIPSPKAEPFKQWLAKVGKERVDAKEGGEIVGKTRKEIETRSGKKISTKSNFLSIKNKKKLK